MRVWMLLAVSLGLLASCGPLGGQKSIAALTQGVLGDRLTSGGGGGAEGEANAEELNPRDVLTREFIEGLDNDLLLVDVFDREATATLLRAGQNGSRVTWISPDGISVTLDRGVIVATRGLGADLMAADSSGLRAVLRGAGSGQLVLETLDGLDQVVREVFDCSVTDRTPDPVTIFERRFATTKVEVTCNNDERAFANNFWIDGNGTIWKSQQFVTPGLGYLGTEVL